MTLFSSILAKISLVLFILLIIKYLTRILAIRFTKFKKINRFFSKTHKPLGIALILTSLVHGLTSSFFIFSLNFGTLAFIIIILLALSYILKGYFKPRFMLIHRILTIISIVLVVAHLVEIKGLNTSNSNDYIENLDNLTDGTYEGIGTGLKGNIKVSVEILNSKIYSITLLESSETKEYMDKAINGLKDKIIERNSTNIDTVAGATYASNGYLEAIQNALRKAKQG